jgi:hypothetical protein
MLTASLKKDFTLREERLEEHRKRGVRVHGILCLNGVIVHLCRFMCRSMNFPFV